MKHFIFLCLNCMAFSIRCEPINRPTHYGILGVPQTATPQEIKRAYRSLAMQLHPDKNQDKKEWAKEQFQELQFAYQSLYNPEQRTVYDKKLWWETTYAKLYKISSCMCLKPLLEFTLSIFNQ